MVYKDLNKGCKVIADLHRQLKEQRPTKENQVLKEGLTEVSAFLQDFCKTPGAVSLSCVKVGDEFFSDVEVAVAALPDKSDRQPIRLTVWTDAQAYRKSKDDKAVVASILEKLSQEELEVLRNSGLNI